MTTIKIDSRHSNKTSVQHRIKFWIELMLKHCLHFQNSNYERGMEKIIRNAHDNRIIKDTLSFLISFANASFKPSVSCISKVYISFSTSLVMTGTESSSMVSIFQSHLLNPSVTSNMMVLKDVVIYTEN